MGAVIYYVHKEPIEEQILFHVWNVIFQLMELFFLMCFCIPEVNICNLATIDTPGLSTFEKFQRQNLIKRHWMKREVLLSADSLR